MITVYAIISEVNSDIYVGIAKDTDNRFKEHNAGKNRYTKGLKPWKKLYNELQPIGKQQEKEKSI
jgi:predicted GIY-YIG superfamily endonuclease